jgi:hypothetical protein
MLVEETHYMGVSFSRNGRMNVDLAIYSLPFVLAQSRRVNHFKRHSCSGQTASCAVHYSEASTP